MTNIPDRVNNSLEVSKFSIRSDMTMPDNEIVITNQCHYKCSVNGINSSFTDRNILLGIGLGYFSVIKKEVRNAQNIFWLDRCSLYIFFTGEALNIEIRL